MSNLPVQIEFGELTESTARVGLSWTPANQGDELAPTIYGPHCAAARTLPAEFRFFEGTAGENRRRAAQALITEPCYWTPELPFTYDLILRWTDSLGVETRPATTIAVGIRRWWPQGQSMFLNRRRTVLRGVCLAAATSRDLQAAKMAGAALLAPPLDAASQQMADRLGLALVVDLRDPSLDLQDCLDRLAWQPSALAAIVDGRQFAPDGARQVARHVPIAFATTPQEKRPHMDEPTKVTILPRWANMLAVEVEGASRPPAWLAQCGRPVIAIRGGESYADISAARAACDELQAELAPEFDFAGYFAGTTSMT